MDGPERTHAIEVTVPVRGVLPFFSRFIKKELEEWLSLTISSQGLPSPNFTASFTWHRSDYVAPGKTIVIVFETEGNDQQVNALMKLVKQRLEHLSIEHRRVNEHGTVKKDMTDKAYLTLATIARSTIIR